MGNMKDTQRSESMSTKQQRIAQIARQPIGGRTGDGRVAVSILSVGQNRELKNRVPESGSPGSVGAPSGNRRRYPEEDGGG